ncbi:hypothetical protein LTR65_003357 [Meristemomyces frigidus]
MTQPEHFAKAIAAASAYITDLDPDAAFFEDKLIAVVRGPDLPPLTLVDLPGLIHASNKEQGDADIQIVKRLVQSYMAMPSSIILAVLAADNNFANQIVLQLAKTADPDARRTLGIITKPDKVDVASKLLMRLHKSAHMHEADFFRRPNWCVLAKDDVGVGSLRDKLSRILLQTIRKSLATLVTDIRERIATCGATLTKLGQPKATEIEQRSQLITISMKLHQIVTAAAEGNYRNDFFNNQSGSAGSSRRLRSRLREILEEFGEHIRNKGHSYNVIERADTSRKAATTAVDFSPAAILTNGAPVSVSKAKFLDGIALRIKQNRGLELEGMCPIDIVADVFQAQSAPWEQIAEYYTSMCSQVVRAFFEDAIQYTAPPHVAEAVLQYYAADRLSTASAKLERKVQELLRPYKKGHLITVNSRYLLQRVERAHEKRRVSEEPAPRSDPPGADVAEALNSGSTPATIFEYMRAYYEIALNTFTENVANLAVENCLVEDLLDLFTPVIVASMDAATVRNLTLEPSTVLRDREMNRKRLQTLKDILQVCNKHGGRFCGTTIQQRAAAPAGSDFSSRDENLSNEAVQSGDNTAPSFQFIHSMQMPYKHAQVSDPAYDHPPRTPEAFLNVSGSRISRTFRSGSRRTPSRTQRSSISSSAESADAEASSEFDDRARLSPTPSPRQMQTAVQT